MKRICSVVLQDDRVDKAHARPACGTGATECKVVEPGELQSQKKKGALAWEREPRKTHSVYRSFFDQGVGSSILVALHAESITYGLSAAKGFQASPRVTG